MKLKKLYLYRTDRQIWRLLLSGKNRLIIEVRDPEKREVYFTCLEAESGKKIFTDLQFEEKFWIGIETIYREIILFHKFQKPDMPGHKMIIAYSIDQKKVLWENEEYNYLFIKDDKVYTFKQLFESRKFFTLDYLTGEMIEDLGTDPADINFMRENLYSEDDFKNYYFPETLIPQSLDPVSFSFVKDYLDEDIAGGIEHIRYGDYLFMNYHKKADFTFSNSFYALHLGSRKLLLKEILFQSTKAIVPDSFFIKDNLLFLLKERQQLLVFRIE